MAVLQEWNYVNPICKGPDRRKPGQSRFTTQRREDDRAKILSGVFEGKTTGTPYRLANRE